CRRQARASCALHRWRDAQCRLDGERNRDRLCATPAMVVPRPAQLVRQLPVALVAIPVPAPDAQAFCLGAAAVTAAYILLGVFILFAYTAEAVTGFGSIVIALSLGALLFPIDWLQTILVPLNIAMTGFLAWRHRRHVDRRLLLRLV